MVCCSTSDFFFEKVYWVQFLEWVVGSLWSIVFDLRWIRICSPNNFHQIFDSRSKLTHPLELVLENRCSLKFMRDSLLDAHLAFHFL
jgi:hypothetical protein